MTSFWHHQLFSQAEVTPHDEVNWTLGINLVGCPFKNVFVFPPSRYHAFDNTRKDTEDNTQVPELMEKVEEMITDNQGLFFQFSNIIAFFVLWCTQ